MCWMQPPMISTSEGGALILAQSDLLEPKTTPEPDTCSTKMLQPKSAGSLRPIFFLLENNPNNQPSKRAHHLALMWQEHNDTKQARTDRADTCVKNRTSRHWQTGNYSKFSFTCFLCILHKHTVCMWQWAQIRPEYVKSIGRGQVTHITLESVCWFVSLKLPSESTATVFQPESSPIEEKVSQAAYSFLQKTLKCFFVLYLISKVIKVSKNADFICRMFLQANINILSCMLSHLALVSLPPSTVSNEKWNHHTTITTVCVSLISHIITETASPYCNCTAPLIQSMWIK